MWNKRLKLRKNWYVFAIISLLMISTAVNAFFDMSLFGPWAVHVAVFVNVFGFIFARRLGGASWREIFSLEVPREKE